MNDEVYYTVADVAKLLRVTPQAVYKWIKQKRIEVVYVGADRRIARSALLRYLDQNTRRHIDRNGTIEGDTRKPIRKAALA